MMVSKFENSMLQNSPHFEDKKILLAISGGIDSMVLLDLCLKKKMNITVAHCNFNLRGEESDLDEVFVKEYCNQNNISFYVKYFDTKKIAENNKESIQITARNLRYHWFEELMQEHKFDYLFTAHHLDDQVETFLINFTRGTGINGLLGIPKENRKIYRPLLDFSREEIEIYAKSNHLNWREDSSNLSDKYLRNKLRHKVIPILKEINPSFLNSFQDTLKSLNASQDFLEEMMEQITQKIIVQKGDKHWIEIDKLLKIRNYKEVLFHFLQPFGFSAWDDIYHLIHAQSGKLILSNQFQILKDRNYLILSTRETNENQEIIVNQIENDANFPLKLTVWEEKSNLEFDKYSIFVDFEKIQFPLKLRKWQEGDYFYPFGMNGKKKLSKYFKDEKINVFEKNEVWILECNHQIVWLVGYRMDERFKIDSQTKKVIKIEFLN